MARRTNNPDTPWKMYRIMISGGISDKYHVKATNKTIARSMARGELNPWIRIIKIEEVSA